jgi:glycosyltransferase involved in cell wall biosynthesis
VLPINYLDLKTERNKIKAYGKFIISSWPSLRPPGRVMEKPAVLLVAGSAEFGSGECQILDYLRCPDKKPFCPQIIFPAEGPLVEQARKAGLNAYVIKGRDYLTSFKELWRQPLAWVYNLSSFVKMSAIIRKMNIQLVLSLSFVNWTGALSARQEGITHVWMIREVLSGRKNWLNFFWGKWLASRLANDLSAQVLLESSLAAEMFRRKRIREKALILPPAIDVDGFDEQLTRLLKNCQVEKSGVSFFFSSPDVKRVKEAVLAAWSGISYSQESQQPGLFLFFPGLKAKALGALKEKILDELRGSGLHPEFPDFGKLPAWWKTFKAAVIFPGFDPMSRIVLEAGLAGVPVLMERGAASEQVLHGLTGFVFDCQNYKELGFYLKSILMDKERACQMGRAAREHISEHHSLESWKKKFEQILTRVLFFPEN